MMQETGHGPQHAGNQTENQFAHEPSEDLDFAQFISSNSEMMKDLVLLKKYALQTTYDSTSPDLSNIISEEEKQKAGSSIKEYILKWVQDNQRSNKGWAEVQLSDNKKIIIHYYIFHDGSCKFGIFNLGTDQRSAVSTQVAEIFSKYDKLNVPIIDSRDSFDISVVSPDSEPRCDWFLNEVVYLGDSKSHDTYFYEDETEVYQRYGKEIRYLVKKIDCGKLKSLFADESDFRTTPNLEVALQIFNGDDAIASLFRDTLKGREGADIFYVFWFLLHSILRINVQKILEKDAEKEFVFKIDPQDASKIIVEGLVGEALKIDVNTFKLALKFQSRYDSDHVVVPIIELDGSNKYVSTTYIKIGYDKIGGFRFGSGLVLDSQLRQKPKVDTTPSDSSGDIKNNLELQKSMPTEQQQEKGITKEVTLDMIADMYIHVNSDAFHFPSYANRSPERRIIQRGADTLRNSKIMNYKEILDGMGITITEDGLLHKDGKTIVIPNNRKLVMIKMATEGTTGVRLHPDVKIPGVVLATDSYIGVDHSAASKGNSGTAYILAVVPIISSSTPTEERKMNLIKCVRSRPGNLIYTSQDDRMNDTNLPSGVFNIGVYYDSTNNNVIIHQIPTKEREPIPFTKEEDTSWWETNGKRYK